MKALAYEISPEREKELIERTARFIVNADAQLGKAMLQGALPWGDLLGWIGFINTPFLQTFTALFGNTGYDLAFMLGQDYRVYVPRILQRVDELEEERQALEESHPQIPLKTRIKGFMENIRRKIKRE